MRTVRFAQRTDLSYGCSEPGDQSGEYVKANVVGEMLAALIVARDALANSVPVTERPGPGPLPIICDVLKKAGY